MLFPVARQGISMTANDRTPPATAESVRDGATVFMRRLVTFAKKIWTNPETVLPRPVGWWRAL